MPNTKRYSYEPNYITRPGEVLEAYLAARGMTQAELAQRCGRPTKTISEIVHGKAAITPDTALQLGRVLGQSAALWQGLEANYRLGLAKRSENESFANESDWARRFPIRELVRRGCIEDTDNVAERVRQLLAFFGVGTIAGWRSRFGEMQPSYRRSPKFEASVEALSAWLRLGELEAENVSCAHFDRAAFLARLQDARALTLRPFPIARQKLVESFAAAGVAIVFVPELPKTHLSGAARWLTKDKALIQLSLRYKRADHLWFTVFHEAGHIVLHGKKQVFVDDHDGTESAEEEEANRFAQDLLIPSTAFQKFRREGVFTRDAVLRFAGACGIAPGVVVGRLQHEKLIPYSRHHDLLEPISE